MNRLAGIIFAAIGFVIALLSVVKITPGFAGTGIMMVLAGGLVIGLSFISRPDTDGEERMSTPATLGLIFFSPGEVFRDLRRHPRWLAALLIMACLSSVYSALFINRLTSERVTNYTVDKTLEMSWIQNNEKAKQQIEDGREKSIADQKNPIMRLGWGISGFAGMLFGYAFLAVLFFLFVMVMGGQMNYFQIFSAVIYASFPVSVIRFLLNTVLLYLKDPADIHPVLGQSSLIQDNVNFLVAPADHPVIFSVLGTLSILWLYWVWLNAIGIRDAGEKVSSGTAWTAALSIYGLLILVVGISGMLFGNFIS